MSLMVRIREKAFDVLVARRNFSMKELADIVGVTDTYLSNVKNSKWDKFKPGPNVRRKLLDALACEFDDIFEVVNGVEKKRRRGPAKKKTTKK